MATGLSGAPEGTSSLEGNKDGALTTTQLNRYTPSRCYDNTYNLQRSRSRQLRLDRYTA